MNAQEHGSLARVASARGRRPRIVFAMLSANTPPETIAQLARLLAPHRVIVHHSPEFLPGMRIDAANVDMVPNPQRTIWADWSMTEGVVRLIDHALQTTNFDYFQLLTPNCLPVRPLAQFEDFIARSPADAHIEHIDLWHDELAWMTYAYRLYASNMSWQFRLLWRMYRWYMPSDDKFIVRAGVAVPTECASDAQGHPLLRARIARTVTHMARGGLFGEHPFGTAFKPMVGSLWFGARRPVCNYIVRRFAEPGVQRWFRPMSQRDEVLFPTLLGNSSYRLAPAHHYISGFDGARTRTLTMDELPAVAASGRFFARKFSDALDDPVRVTILKALRDLERSPDA